MFVVKKITALETYSVRHQVLRKGKPIETCAFIGDDEATTTHFGLFKNEKLIGVVSVFKTKNELFNAESQFQIRGMAVLEEFQNQGFGAQLLKEAEKFCIEEKTNLIWFNAREKAVSFYKKLGFESIGDSFEINTIGTHFVMLKRF
jgi:ribosomal protein S18 acetylase RimI-like enzyme